MIDKPLPIDADFTDEEGKIASKELGSFVQGLVLR